MEFKGTKGEWTLPHFADPKSNCKCGYVLCEKYCGSVATVNYSNDSDNWRNGGYPPVEEAKYNAYLISASPELLQALQSLVNGIRERGYAGHLSDYLKQADTIIAKALGKEADDE